MFDKKFIKEHWILIGSELWQLQDSFVDIIPLNESGCIRKGRGCLDFGAERAAISLYTVLKFQAEIDYSQEVAGDIAFTNQEVQFMFNQKMPVKDFLRLRDYHMEVYGN